MPRRWCRKYVSNNTIISLEKETNLYYYIQFSGSTVDNLFPSTAKLIDDNIGLMHLLIAPYSNSLNGFIFIERFFVIYHQLYHYSRLRNSVLLSKVRESQSVSRSNIIYSMMMIIIIFLELNFECYGGLLMLLRFSVCRYPLGSYFCKLIRPVWIYRMIYLNILREGSKRNETLGITSLFLNNFKSDCEIAFKIFSINHNAFWVWGTKITLD